MKLDDLDKRFQDIGKSMESSINNVPDLSLNKIKANNKDYSKNITFEINDDNSFDIGDKELINTEKKHFIKRYFTLKNAAAVLGVLLLMTCTTFIISHFSSKPPISPTESPKSTTISPSPTPAPIEETDSEEIFIHYADLTHDGVDEKIVVDMGEYTGYGEKPDYDYVVKVYDVSTGEEDLIYTEEIYERLGHGLYLYKHNNSTYLMRWDPMISNGTNIEYVIFSLGKSETNVLDSGELEIGKYYTKEELESFYNKAKSYMQDSYVLIDTFGMLYYSESGNLKSNPYYTENWFQNTIDKASSYNEKNFFNTIYADVTHDGVDEKIVLDRSKYDDQVEINIFKVKDGKETLIWSTGAGYTNASQNALYLYKEDDKQYLLRWNPYMGQGAAYHAYEMFHLTPEGKEILHEKKFVYFDAGYRGINASSLSEIIGFCDSVRHYLSNCVKIIDTNEYNTAEGKSTKNVLDVCSRDWYLNILGIDRTLVKKNAPAPSIVSKVKKNLKLGMTRSDVHKILGKENGTDLEEMRGMMERYDFSKGDSYGFSNFMDYVDYNGLIKGDVQCILFVSYDLKKDTVFEYSMFYTDGDKISEFMLNRDGEEKFVQNDVNALLKDYVE